jgi:dolichyl-diphosphooligosaccharide--protein glycosyltransferase
MSADAERCRSTAMARSREGIEMAPVQGGPRRFPAWLAPLALLLLAFLVRCLPFQSIFLREGIVFFDPDAYYHMRRIVFSAVHFPKTLGFDPYINHPDGGQPIWTPVFDWCVAALLLPFRNGDDVAALERVAVFVPPLLGAATVVALYVVARRHFGKASATLAGVILALLSGHSWYSQVGFIDHHAGEALAATAMLGAGMTLLANASSAVPPPRGVRGGVLATGVGFGAAFLLWPGMLLHVAIVDLALVGFALTRRERVQAVAFAKSLAALHGIAFALVAPLALSTRWMEWGRFSPVVLSAFQPWLMAVACLWSLACAAAWRLDASGRSPVRRLLTGLALGIGLWGASVLAFPGLLAAARDPWDWFAGDDPFQRIVGESLPLFHSAGGFSLRIAFARLSAFSLLVPVALVAGTIRARRRPCPAPLLLFLWWTLGLVVATVVQRRFFNSASVGVALLFALCLTASHRALVGRFPRARLPVLAALGAAALALLLPTLRAHLGDASNLGRALRGVPPRFTKGTQERAVIAELASGIRTHTPDPSPWLDASAKPAYGVLAPWEIGHAIEYQGRRPTVSDNFGNDLGERSYQGALRYFVSDEAGAAKLLEELSVRYVVMQRDTTFLGGEPPRESMAIALFRRDGSRAGPVAAAQRHRLIYDSKPLFFTSHPREPRYKVFEFVPGAQIVGESTPGARIRATLGVRSNRGRRFLYSALFNAAPDGRYELRVPYSNRGGPRQIEVDPAYRLECEDEQRLVSVDESDVMEGARVEGPRLCAGS